MQNFVCNYSVLPRDIICSQLTHDGPTAL